MEWLSSFLNALPRKFFDNITAVAIVAGLFALLKFVFEYSRDNRRKRMELYLRLRDEFRTNPRFSDIFEFLDKYTDAGDTDKQHLAKTFISKVRPDTREEFAAFLEDVAMTVSSDAMKPDVAHYMFGYYAICCWENDVFWTDLDRNTPYWALLGEFVEKMKAQREIQRHQKVFGRLRV